MTLYQISFTYDDEDYSYESEGDDLELYSIGEISLDDILDHCKIKADWDDEENYPYDLFSDFSSQLIEE